MEELLNNLEFNEINMYKYVLTDEAKWIFRHTNGFARFLFPPNRNDYPIIDTTLVPKYKIPYLTESICFVDMKKSIGRVVATMDWHPVYSGLVVVAYSFSALSTSVPRKCA